jgi:hypothetical protein
MPKTKIIYIGTEQNWKMQTQNHLKYFLLTRGNTMPEIKIQFILQEIKYWVLMQKLRNTFQAIL